VTLAELLTGELLAVLLVFARLGAALMLLPAFGESYVNPRLRLWLGLLTSTLVAGALGDRLPPVPTEPAALVALLGREVLVGLAIGGAVRLALAALQVAGSIVALQSGLAAAAFFDPSEATQGTVPGALLATTFLVLLLVTDTHHTLLLRIVAGYGTLPPGGPLPEGDLLGVVARLGNAAFGIGLAVAAPVLVASFLGNLALGLLARLVPALQILFVALPLQLVLALSALALAFGAGLAVALRFLDRTTLWLVG
jgi:flagellar biosynthetic protein FliR